MITVSSDECPIWKVPAQVFHSGSFSYQVRSQRAGGAYEIDTLALNQMPEEAQFRARLTTWLVDQHRAGEQIPQVNSWAIKAVAARPALMLSQRVERFFLLLSSMRFRPGQAFYISTEQGRPSSLDLIMAWTETDHHDDANGLLDYLEEEGLIQSPASGAYRLTAHGFARLEATERSAPATTQGFVAMWFGREMDEAFQEGFEPAIRDAGYQALRIDRKEHANKIDDEIVIDLVCVFLPVDA